VARDRELEFDKKDITNVQTTDRLSLGRNQGEQDFRRKLRKGNWGEVRLKKEQRGEGTSEAKFPQAGRESK